PGILESSSVRTRPRRPIPSPQNQFELRRSIQSVTSIWRVAMNGISVSLLLLMAELCHAETLSLVRGRVQSDVAHLGSDMIAELENLDRRGPANRSGVGGDGSFEFRDVTTGRHALRITTLYGDIICEQMVDVLNYGTEMSIRLPNLSSDR